MTIRTTIRIIYTLLVVAASGAIWAAPAAAAPGRAYELVSPLDKNGGSVIQDTFGGFNVPFVTASPDGDRILYFMQPAFLDDAESALAFGSYNVAARHGDGWRSTSVSAPPLPPGSGPPPGTAASPAPVAWSSDLTRIALWTSWALDPDHDQDRAFQDTDVYLWQGGGPLELLSCPPEQACGGQVSVVGRGGSRAGDVGTPDLRHVVFETAEPLVAGAPDTQQVYDRAGEDLRLVSQGTPLFGGAPLADTAAAASTQATGSRPGTISDDGSRIFFTSGGRLYVRVDASETIEVSRSHTANPSSATFLGALPDGNAALFRSTAALTPDDPNTVADLYAWRYDPSTGADSLRRVAALPQVGPGPSPDNPGPGSGTAPDNPTHADIVAMPTDPSGPLRVYFLTRSVSGSDRRWDLFVATDPASPGGTVRHVAAVGEGGFFDTPCHTNTSALPNPFARTCARASSDGRFLAFDSDLPLSADDEDDSFDTFLYDAEAGTLTRASIGSDGPGGARGNGPSDARLLGPLGDSVLVNAHPNVADDGAVFFHTEEALVPEDHNTVQDVYEFSDGGVALISGGRADADLPSFYVDNSADGRDVFFLTATGLDPRDSDGGWDIYDARVGGGFPEPPPPCDPVADACQGATPRPPGRATPDSSTFSGPGNPPGDLVLRRAKQNKRRGTAELTVKVPGPGALELAQSKKLNRAQTRAEAQGEVKLKVKPRGKAKRQLKRESREKGRAKLKASATVTFTPDRGEPRTKTKQLKLVRRQASNKGKQGRRR